MCREPRHVAQGATRPLRYPTWPELERLFDGDEGGGDEADHNCMEGVIADALGDWGMGVGAGAHGGGGF